MNYDHHYHAGNFADVIKHIIITAIQSKLQSKDKPLFVMDTHAGAGHYDLSDPRVLITNEIQAGVAQLWRQRHHITDPLLLQYYRILKAFNEDDQVLKIYPGSPQIFCHLMSHQTRLVLCEKNPVVYDQLIRNIHDKKLVHIYNEDGYNGLIRFVPPPERRGLFLIDAPFEREDEFTVITNSLSVALKKFPQGTYVIWYPIKYVHHVQNFLKALVPFETKNIFITEIFRKDPAQMDQLNGSGIAVINLPYLLHENLAPALKECEQLLSATQQYSIRTFWLRQPT